MKAEQIFDTWVSSGNNIVAAHRNYCVVFWASLAVVVFLIPS